MNGKASIKLENNRLMVSGDLDFNSVVTVWNASLPLFAECSQLQFDFSGVSSTKSAGLALLVEWIKFGRRENKSVTFQHIPQQLISIAGVCGLDGVISATMMP